MDRGGVRVAGLHKRIPGQGEEPLVNLVARPSEPLPTLRFTNTEFLVPLSFAVGGLVVEAVGPEAVLLAAGATGTLAATIGLAVPAVHRWRPFVDGDARQPAASSPRGSPQP